MSLEVVHNRAILEVPDDGRVVHGTGGAHEAIGAEFSVHDHLLVAVEVLQLVGGVQIPDGGRAVVRGGEDVLAVGAEACLGHVFILVLQEVFFVHIKCG